MRMLLLINIFFGSDIIAAPISTMVDMSTNTTNKTVWLPPGNWISWNGSTIYQGPILTNFAYTQAEIPLYVQDGTILALKTFGVANFQTVAPDLTWTIWPSNTGGSTTIYEDDGVSLEYTVENSGAWTNATYTMAQSNTLLLKIGPTMGTFDGQPFTRSHSVQIRPVSLLQPFNYEPQQVLINQNTINQGTQIPGWYIVTNTNCSLSTPISALIINGGPYPINEIITVEIDW